MARSGPGFFKKMMHVIGLEDNQQAYDEAYDEPRYNSGRSASSARPSTYVPRQQNSRTADTRRRTVVQDERSARPQNQSRYGAGQRQDFGGINEGYTVRRPARDFDEELDQGGVSRRQDSRRASEPEIRPSSRGASQPVARNQAPAPVQRGAMPQVYPVTLRNLAECGDVVDALIANNMVVLNLEKLDDATIQRVVDTLSGAAFALGAKIQKTSDRAYFIAPRNVPVNDLNGYGRRG